MHKTTVPQRSEGTSISRFATAKLLITLSLLSSIYIPHSIAYSNESTLEIEAFDSIAGYTTMAQIEDALPYEDIEILITKPNGGEVAIDAKTDENGEVKAEINGYHLKSAGNYEIKAKYSSLDEEYGKTDSFKVYEDTVSTNKSTLEAENTTAEASGSDPVKLTIYLKDRYGNPIKNHSISIISSRNEDYITPYDSTKTSDQGEVVFYAYSEEAGISTYTAYDQTSGITLDARAKIAYISPSSLLEDIGGDNLFTSVFLASDETTGETGPIDHFKIEDLSEEVKTNELLNLTVTAYDADENVVMNYTGEIRFSSSDDNATLPTDYTFKAEDQGSHTFSLSLRFATTGTQTVTVTNTSNRDLKGEIEVNVTTGSGSTTSSTTSSTSNDELKLTNPQSGTYSSGTIKVEGTAPYGSNVKIYDNDIELTQIQTQPDNTFEAEIELGNGEHSLYIKAFDSTENELGQSETTDIKIDTEAPAIDYVETTTEGTLETGSTFDVTLYSEPGLREIGLILEDKIYELTESIDQEGTYTGVLVAPETEGVYQIDTILVDELGNEIQYSNQMTISVMAKEETPVEEPKVVNPSTVAGIKAINGDTKITLTWESAISGSDTTVIDHYKIYYGPETDLIYSTVETLDSSTTWYIPNLQNSSTYYFAITAIDSEGNESLEKGEIVSGTPVGAVDTLHESAPEPSLEDLGTPDETAETGPGLAWIILATLAFTEIYFKTKKILKQDAK